MSCTTSTLGSGKIIDLCVNPKCTNNHLSIKREICVQSPIYSSKEAELETLKKDLIWLNLNMNYYKTRVDSCEQRIRELS